MKSGATGRSEVVPVVPGAEVEPVSGSVVVAVAPVVGVPGSVGALESTVAGSEQANRTIAAKAREKRSRRTGAHARGGWVQRR